MPSRGLKFISQFLRPNLDSKRFGTRLMWLNEKHAIFQVQWNHKSASDWTKDDAEVFMEWDKIKGRCMSDKDRFTKGKQRFRAIIYKLIKARHITEICCSDKYIKIFYFGTKEIPSDVIVEVLNSRGRGICKISTENMYPYDPEAVMDTSEIFGRSYLTDNQINMIEDHKYTILKEEAILGSEDMVPDNRLKDLNFLDPSYVYVDIISEKQSLYSVSEDSHLQDSNDCAVINISSWLTWKDLDSYELIPEESLFRPEQLLHSEKI